MANNQYKNKIIYDGTVLIDLSSDTVSPENLMEGYTAHDASGAPITGVATRGPTNVVTVTEEQLSGGGIVKHINAVDISDTTAEASDVTQGKYFYTASGIKTVGTASGGVSNVVSGTFIGTTDGSIVDVVVPYNGSGYPLAVVVAPVGGIYGNDTYSASINRYTIGFVSAYKTYANTVPTYASTGDENQYSVMAIYKDSATVATTYSYVGSANMNITYGTSADPSGFLQSLLFRTNTLFSVKILDPNNIANRGFHVNVEYAYTIIYSS